MRKLSFKNLSFQHLLTIFCGLCIVVLAGSTLSAWTGPTATAPGNNVSTPVNVGTTDQIKNAGLSVNALAVFGSQYIQNNLGIGTTNPAQKLDVQGGNINTSGEVDAQSYIRTNNAEGTNTEVRLGAAWGRPGLYVGGAGNVLATGGLALSGTGNTSDMYINTSGNVGIGTVGPGAKVEIDGSTSQPALSVGDSGIDNGNSYGMVNLTRPADKTKAELAFIRAGNYVWQMGYVQNTNTFGIFPWNFSGTQGTPTMAFSGADVGIGTITPAYPLDVNGMIYSETGGIKFPDGSVQTTAASAGADTVVRLDSIQTFTSGSNATFTTPANTSYIVVETWGGGGGGADNSTNGTTGGTTCFGTNTTACTTPLLQATGGTGGISLGTTAFGGSGGTGSGGDVNLTGKSGGSGATSADGAYDVGGGGGSAPRGGGSGAGGGIGYNNGAAGSPYGGGGGAAGGGGGGGYSMKLIKSPAATYYYTVGIGGPAGASVGAWGGAGGAGGIVIYVYKTVTSGTDLAENYPVNDPSISAGGIVSIDTDTPVTVGRAVAGDNHPLAGIISTKPGEVLTDKTGVDAVGERPVALAGRVPTKVNMENGPIAIGDKIALSSTPGVGRKASAFEASVGTALEPFMGGKDGASQGTITVLVNLQPAVDVEAIGKALLTPSPTGFDFVHALLARITSSFADSANGIHQIFADIGDFHTVNTITLCVQKSNGTPICVTGDQLATLLSRAGETGVAPTAITP